MKKINFKKEEGFTIMETLVAIFILLLAITGPMVFSQNALRASFHARDQITAFYLAQDAIEYVKNVRDDNILEGGGDWMSGLDGCTYTAGGCTVDTTTDDGSIDTCDGTGTLNGCLGSEEDGSLDNHLQIDNSGYITAKNISGEDSGFSRTVYIEETVDGREAEVVVKMRWTSHDTIGAREITVVEYMYNWGSVLING